MERTQIIEMLIPILEKAIEDTPKEFDNVNMRGDLFQGKCISEDPKIIVTYTKVDETVFADVYYHFYDDVSGSGIATLLGEKNEKTSYRYCEEYSRFSDRYIAEVDPVTHKIKNKFVENRGY